MPDEATHEEVTRERVVPGERDEVWHALTESDWLGDPLEIEAVPGGGVRAGEREGFVEEVEPEERLSFWWAAPGEESTRVEVTLEDADSGTLVRVVESRPLELVDSWAGSLAGPQLLAAA
jgi:uncharacterized protein YndB with AHSA1/START domain